MAQVDLVGVAKRYGPALAVDDVTLTVPEGAFFSLLGPSGSGKTTLLRLVAGFVQPDAGEIRIGERVVNNTPPHLRNIGMVFQSYALFPHRTVFDNVAFGLEMRGVRGPEAMRRVGTALEMVRLSGREKSFPRELSGGQQQRVAIARSIVIAPALLLLDEPLSALDRKLRAEMQIELRALQQQLRITALYVTHDQEEALAMSDGIAVLRGGRIAQQGTARELYEHPADRFVADFLGGANLIDGILAQQNGEWAAHLQGDTVPVITKPGFTDGQQISLVLRPERLSLCRPGQREGRVGIPATVTGLVYLGSDVRVLLQTTAGEPLVARIPSQSHGFEVGNHVTATWLREEAVIVAR